MKRKRGYLEILITVFSLCILILGVSYFFIYNEKLIGFVIALLGILILLPLKLFGIKIKHIYPDIIFGIFDNGILAVFAVLGADIFGIFGAILVAVIGNSITDGIAGVFEGYIAEKSRKKGIDDKRTVLCSAVGKMSGCLLGAGIVLIFAWVIL